MLKRVFAIVMVAVMLLGCMIPAAAEDNAPPANDAEAVAAGYHAKYVEDGVTKYIKFAAKPSAVSGDNRNSELSVVPAGGTVTLLTDVTIGFELLLNGKYTVEGNGKTVNGAIRSDSGSANVILQNLTLNSPAKFGNVNAYLYQINAGNVCTFKNCTVNINGTPSFGAVIAFGTLNFENTVINYTTEGTKPLFYNNSGERKISLNNSSIVTNGEAAVFSVPDVGFDALVGDVTVNGEVLSSSSVAWDGTTVDTAWFDASDVKESYELDTPAKLAGLAKLIKDAGTSNYPSKLLTDKVITFYITQNMDLGGHEWLPIGDTYGTRFGGNLVGKLGGVEGAAVTISGLKITSANDNTGFIGSMHNKGTVANFIFESPVVNSTHNTTAVVCGYARSGGTFENITVKNATLTAQKKWVGGICSYAKYGDVTFKNCVFDGTVLLSGAAEQVGGLIGCSNMNTTIDNCYVGGTIVSVSETAMLGGFVGKFSDTHAASGISAADYPHMGETLLIKNSQFDAILQNAGEAVTGALIGSVTSGAVADRTVNIVMNHVFVSGVSMMSGSKPEVGFVRIGEIAGSGKTNIAATECASLTGMAMYGKKAGTVTLTGADSGFTVYTAEQIAGDNGKTTVGDAGWTMRAGLYPVLTIAKNVAGKANANADYAWFDFAKTEMEIANFNQLVGFSVLSKLYNFGGKTLKLTADIDGTSKQEGQTLAAGGKLNDHIEGEFRGTFNKNGHTVTNVEFELGESGKFVVTWIVNGAETREEYNNGETPSFKGETVKPADDVYSYTFKGWDKELVPVVADVTYEAKWDKTKLEKETEAVTDAPETEPTTEPATDEIPTEDEGCASVAGVLALPMLLAAALVVTCKKRSK